VTSSCPETPRERTFLLKDKSLPLWWERSGKHCVPADRSVSIRHCCNLPRLYNFLLSTCLTMSASIFARNFARTAVQHGLRTKIAPLSTGAVRFASYFTPGKQWFGGRSPFEDFSPHSFVFSSFIVYCVVTSSRVHQGGRKNRNLWHH